MRALVGLLVVALCGCGPADREGAIERAPVAPVVANSQPPSPETPNHEPAADTPIRILEPDRASFDAACAAGSTNILDADLNDDGALETVCWSVINDGEVSGIQVGLRTATNSPYIWLPARSGLQVAICSTDNVRLTVEHISEPEYRAELGLPDDWPAASITVTDGVCDPAHLFYFEGESQFGFGRV